MISVGLLPIFNAAFHPMITFFGFFPLSTIHSSNIQIIHLHLGFIFLFLFLRVLVFEKYIKKVNNYFLWFPSVMF